MQASGLHRLPDGRVRKLGYNGNQYDPGDLIKASKAAQSAAATAGGYIGKLANGLAPVNVLLDSHALSTDSMSAGRFIYRTTGNVSSFGLGLVHPAAGGIVGLGFFGGEVIYDAGSQAVSNIQNSARSQFPTHRAFNAQLLFGSGSGRLPFSQ